MKMANPKTLRKRAIRIRLSAYYKHGGVGLATLKAERKAKALEARADEIERAPSA
jgi:hypothetical protein